MFLPQEKAARSIFLYSQSCIIILFPTMVRGDWFLSTLHIYSSIELLEFLYSGPNWYVNINLICGNQFYKATLETKDVCKGLWILTPSRNRIYFARELQPILNCLVVMMFLEYLESFWKNQRLALYCIRYIIKLRNFLCISRFFKKILVLYLQLPH